MAFRAIISVIILSLVITISALPTQASETSTQMFPYLGQVIGTDVYVRSGFGDPDGQNNFYPCAKTSEPTHVKVIAEMNGWLQIEPVTGCFSVIHKRYVKVDATGVGGTVTADNVRVRAAGQMRNSNFSSEHQRLDEGQKVLVLGEISDKFGDWYKIAPPEGAYYWIYEDFVAHTGKTENESVTPTESEAAQVEPVVVEAKIDPEAPDATPAEQPGDPLLAKIQTLEQQLKAEYEKPLTQRDYPSLLSAYKSLQVPADSYLVPRVQARIASLEEVIGQRAEMDQIQGIIADTLAQRKQMEMNRTRSQVEVQVEAGQRNYAARGVLAASQIFSGSAGTAKRYFVQQPGTRKILAYVQASDSQVDLSSYVGMEVGIHGPAKYSPGISLDLVDAISVVVLNKNPQSMGLPKPIIKMPPVKAKPAPEKQTEEVVEEAAETDDATNVDEADEAANDDEAAQADKADEATNDDEAATQEDESDTGLPVAGETDDSSSTKEIDDAEYE